MQVKLFQLGFGRKTIDGFSKELAVDPEQTAVDGKSRSDERERYGGVCLGGWEGPPE